MYENSIVSYRTGCVCVHEIADDGCDGVLQYLTAFGFIGIDRRPEHVIESLYKQKQQQLKEKCAREFTMRWLYENWKWLRLRL